jgi:oligosaccharide repeat unit polymerase
MEHLDNILTGLIFIFLHYLLFFLNYELMKKRIVHPAVLFSLLWFIIVLIHFIFSFTILSELFPISISTYLIFFIGVVAFSFGSFIQTIIWEKKENGGRQLNYQFHTEQIKINLTFRFITLIIITIGLPFYIYASYKIFLVSNIDNFFVGLRTELSYGDEDIGPLKYLTTFSFVVFAFNLYSFLNEKNRTNKLLLIISFLITLTYSVFVTGRGLFFMLLSIFVGMTYILDKKFSIRKLFRFSILFIIAFISIGIIYGKGGNTDNTVTENVLPATQTTANYLVASLNALEWDLKHNPEINYRGDNSLRFFIKIGEELNLMPKMKVNELVQPFVFVPYPTNVYTYYSPYLKDFGKFYAWFMIAFFGFIHTYLHNKAILTKNIRYCLYFSFMIYPLLMSFFQDQYLSLFSSWFQIVLYIELFIFLNKFFVAKNVRHSYSKLE